MVLPVGGPDFVARYRTRDLAGLGHEVTVLTRREKPGVPGAPGSKSEPAKEAALALGPLAGQLVFLLFALGRFPAPSQYSPHHRNVLAPGKQQGAIALCLHLYAHSGQ